MAQKETDLALLIRQKSAEKIRDMIEKQQNNANLKQVEKLEKEYTLFQDNSYISITQGKCDIQLVVPTTLNDYSVINKSIREWAKNNNIKINITEE